MNKRVSIDVFDKSLKKYEYRYTPKSREMYETLIRKDFILRWKFLHWIIPVNISDIEKNIINRSIVSKLNTLLKDNRQKSKVTQ